MAATTEYGSYVNATSGSGGNVTLRDDIAAALDEYAEEYNLDDLEWAIRDRINEALEDTGITMAGDEFYGPWEPTDDEQAAMNALLERADEADLPAHDEPSCPQVAVALAWQGFWDLAEEHAKGE